MPESERPDRPREVERVLERLASAVASAAGELDEARRRAAEAEARAARLEEVLTAGGGEVSGDAADRFERIAAENRRLKDTLGQAREKAERLRARLAMVEDEV